MKSTLILLIFFTLRTLHTFAQDSTQIGLPEGATMRLGKGSVNEIAYSPDGTRLAVASSIGIWLYDTTTGDGLALLSGHASSVISVAFSPDRNTIASGSRDKTVQLWNAHTGKRLRTLNGHSDRVNSVSFSPDGNTIASGSSDQTVRIWNAWTGGATVDT